jgi:hypothetical protein
MTFIAIRKTRNSAICYYCAGNISVHSRAIRESFLDNLRWRSVMVCVSCAQKRGVES